MDQTHSDGQRDEGQPQPQKDATADATFSSLSASALRASLLRSLTDTAAVLSRLTDLQERPHLHSSRTRRACVAIILRLKHPDDPNFDKLATPKPKIKKTRKPKPTAAGTTHKQSTQTSGNQTQPAASASFTATAPASIPPAEAEAVMAVASQAQVLSRVEAPKTAAAASTAPPPPVAAPAPEIDTYTRQLSSIPAAVAAQTRSRLSALAAESWVQQSQLEVLFMQRALNPTDRWSGQMSFPGGRNDRGESDESTVFREVSEEIGWDLRDPSQFVALGQLDDKPMDGLKNVKPLAVGIFVFLQVSRRSPPLCLEPSEVSAILFVPLSYFIGLHRVTDFGKIYHPLMLQILQPRAKEHPPSSAAAGSAAAVSTPATSAPRPFDLRLIGYPHKREGKPLREVALELLSAEQASSLQRLEATHEHISDLDEAPFAPAAPGLQQLRHRLQSLAHELPLPPSPIPTAATALRARLHLPHLPHLPPRPAFLPSLDQLASLRFPALSLPGVWVSAAGHGGVSTQDDMRVLVSDLLPISAAAPSAPGASTSSLPTAAASASSCPPPFILWGMTLEKTCELLLFLGHPFMFDFFQRGSDKRSAQENTRTVRDLCAVLATHAGLTLGAPALRCVQSSSVSMVVQRWRDALECGAASGVVATPHHTGRRGCGFHSRGQRSIDDASRGRTCRRVLVLLHPPRSVSFLVSSSHQPPARCCAACEGSCARCMAATEAKAADHRQALRRPRRPWPSQKSIFSAPDLIRTSDHQLCGLAH